MQTETRSQRIAVTGATGRVGRRSSRSSRARPRRRPDRAVRGCGRGQRRRPRRSARRGRDDHRCRHRPLARPGAGDGLLHRLGAEPAASGRGSRSEADRPRLDHRHRQVPHRLQRGEGGAGADAAAGPAPGPDRARGAVPRVHRAAARLDDPGWRRPRARDADTARGCPRGRRTLADVAEEPEIENGRITEVAGPQAERLADVAAALFATRGVSVEIRESRGGLLAEPASPDAAAYAQGAALPNAGAKLAGPTFRGLARDYRGVGAGRGQPSASIRSFLDICERPATPASWARS